MTEIPYEWGRVDMYYGLCWMVECDTADSLIPWCSTRSHNGYRRRTRLIVSFTITSRLLWPHWCRGFLHFTPIPVEARSVPCIRPWELTTGLHQFNYSFGASNNWLTILSDAIQIEYDKVSPDTYMCMRVRTNGCNFTVSRTMVVWLVSLIRQL